MKKSHHPLYKTHAAMMERCYNEKSAGYANYGGRGITVDPRWHDLYTFAGDVGHRPEGHTLDRVDCDGDYTPSNCRWATNKQQQNNRRNNLRFTVTLNELLELCGIVADHDTNAVYRMRLKHGWSLWDTIKTPLKRYNKAHQEA